MEQSHSGHGTSGVTDFARGAPTDTLPLSQSVQHSQATHTNEDSHATRRGSSAVDGEQTGAGVYRADSTISQSHTLTPSRGGTLKKKGTLKKSGSVKRSSSRKSLRAESVKSVGMGEKEDHAHGWNEEMNSAFYTPVPTTGNPTEILANRFQGNTLLVTRSSYNILNRRDDSSDNFADLRSVAEGTQRFNRVFPRHPKVLRSPVQVPFDSLKCNQQYHASPSLPYGRRYRRCYACTTGLPQAISG